MSDRAVRAAGGKVDGQSGKIAHIAREYIPDAPVAVIEKLLAQDVLVALQLPTGKSLLVRFSTEGGLLVINAPTAEPKMMMNSKGCHSTSRWP